MKYLALFLVLILSSCAAVKESADEARLSDSNWVLTAIEQRPVNFDGRAFLKIDEKENKISGKAVCNSFFGEYEMIGQKITFSDIGSTKMYCEGLMADENAIISNLQRATRYEVKANFLYFYSDNSLVLTFKR